MEPEQEPHSEDEEEEEEDSKPKTEASIRLAPLTMARVGGKMCLEIQLGLSRVELRSISAPDWESWHGAAPETVAILKDKTKAGVPHSSLAEPPQPHRDRHRL
ncbi:hypothetical protein Goshw_005858 [Gossypium schwendimanii]|uniref:Uncharacterized protein n=1 Tax=Gossypium schwendimanii TaxID=34291 RepID=A0A7J9M1T2_GOSSC|nr:hypothetical protein [Gossypium schwendimanii]